MTISEWLMFFACLLFILGGAFMLFEDRSWRVSSAMILLGIANGLLLWEASS